MIYQELFYISQENYGEYFKFAAEFMQKEESCAAKCKGQQEEKKSGKEMEELSDKLKEFKRFWLC